MENNSRFKHRPALDGIRGVCILSVLFFHFTAFPRGGYLGVDIFFILSGFLITIILLEEFEEKHTISLVNFYVRRTLRLVPALWLLLACVLILSLIIPNNTRALRIQSVLYGLTYTTNWAIVFNGKVASELSHLWSLAMEEQFYLSWPLVLLGVLRAKIDLKIIKYLLVFITFLVFLYRGCLAHLGVSDAHLVLRFDTGCGPILTGCCCAFWWKLNCGKENLSQKNVLRFKLLIWFALSIIACIILFPSLSFINFGGSAILSIAAGTFILSCLICEKSIISSLLSSKPLVFLGKISYSLYLWHIPVWIFAQQVSLPEKIGFLPYLLLIISVSFGAAIASHFCVERPFLKLKKSFADVSKTAADS